MIMRNDYISICKSFDEVIELYNCSIAKLEWETRKERETATPAGRQHIFDILARPLHREQATSISI